MFKSCRNLFNLSRKLGSVVIGLGLAGVLFAGQVSAGGLRWDPLEVRFLANVVEELVEAVENGTIDRWTWDTVAEQLNILIPDSRRHRTAETCRKKWCRLAEQYEEFRRIYDPSSRATPSASWTDEDIGRLADVVGGLVRAVRNDTTDHWTWDMVATAFNDQTNQERTSDACRLKWSELAEQYEEFRRIYNPSRYNLDRSEAGRRRSSRNSRRFTPDQDAMLMRLVPLNRDQGGRIQWRTIAQSLNAGKSPRQCRDRYRLLSIT